MKAYIFSQISEASRVMSSMQTDEALLVKIGVAAQACIDSLQQGGKLLLAGNGGSAADAQHIAGEFVSRFAFDRPGLPAIALTTDTSILTADFSKSTRRWESCGVYAVRQWNFKLEQ